MKKHLTCSPKERNRFLHRTEQMLDAFLEENPDATEEDLYLALGSPEELAEQMMEECAFDAREYPKHHTNKFALAGIVLCLTLACGFLAYQFISSRIRVQVNPIKYIYFSGKTESFENFYVIDSSKEG